MTALPPAKGMKPANTTKKSNTFHGSRKYFQGFLPSAKTLMKISAQKIPTTNSSRMVQTVDTVSDRTWIWIPTKMAARKMAEITNVENARLSATLLNQQEISVTRVDSQIGIFFNKSFAS